MKFFDAGQHAEGFIAIGQVATGVIAIGQVATGVIAIGQIARGVIVIGQLAIGVVGFGQAVVALTYGGGMFGVAGIRVRQSLLVLGLAGSSDPWPRGRRFPGPAPIEWRRTAPVLTAARAVAAAGVVLLVFFVGLRWMGDLPERIESPPPPTFAPGSR